MRRRGVVAPLTSRRYFSKHLFWRRRALRMSRLLGGFTGSGDGSGELVAGAGDVVGTAGAFGAFGAFLGFCAFAGAFSLFFFIVSSFSHTGFW